MILTDTGGTAFTPCPAGPYLARCIQLIDIGTVESSYEGKPTRARKVLVAWEVLDDECRRDDGQPFILSKRFTQSLHEKAGLRKILTSWRGRDFTANELKGFEFRNVLGKDAFISVVHTEKDGKTFANIAAVMKVPKGMTAPVASNEPLLHWDMAKEPDWTVFAQLPSRLQTQIAASPEYQSLDKPKSISLPGAPAAPAPQAPAPMPEPPAGQFPGPFDDMEDVPF